MDYETIVKCFIEMKLEGQYAIDVADILRNEILNATVISKDKRFELLKQIDHWLTADKSGKDQGINNIWEILVEKDQFKIEFAKHIAYRLNVVMTEDIK